MRFFYACKPNKNFELFVFDFVASTMAAIFARNFNVETTIIVVNAVAPNKNKNFEKLKQSGRKNCCQKNQTI